MKDQYFETILFVSFMIILFIRCVVLHFQILNGLSNIIIHEQSRINQSKSRGEQSLQSDC